MNIAEAGVEGCADPCLEGNRSNANFVLPPFRSEAVSYEASQRFAGGVVVSPSNRKPKMR